MLKPSNIFLAIAIALTANLAWSSEYSRSHGISGLPDYYSKSFQEQGIFQGFERSGGTVLISARRYKLSNNIKVHTLNTEFASANSLRSGKDVAFQTDGSVGKTRIITEIWILPEGTAKRH